MYKDDKAPGKGSVEAELSSLPAQLPSLGIQAGDVMYFYNEEEGVHHAAVISKVENGEIRYPANSANRHDYALEAALEGSDEEDGVLIVRLKDER